MRSNLHQGRFGIRHETMSIYEGIAEDLGGTVGVQVNWWRWQDYYLEENIDAIVDDIYDTSSPTPGQGRRWQLPFKLPVIMAQLVRGGNNMNERGFYTTDTLRLVINAGDAERLIPDIVRDEPNKFIKDRVEWRGQVFTPTLVNPRGAFHNRFAVVSVDCREVNSEELVNDPQFQRYAEIPKSEYLRRSNDG